MYSSRADYCEISDSTRRDQAMKITGHRTQSIYERYHIGKDSGTAEAGRKLREFGASQEQFFNKSPMTTPQMKVQKPEVNES